MVPPALIGLLAGLFVRNVPSLKRTMGQPVLGVKQHRPKLAFMISYACLIGIYTIPTYHSVIKGFDITFYIITTVLAGPLVFSLVNHCHAFYIQQTSRECTGATGGGRSGICRMRVSAKYSCKVMGRTGT